MPNESIECVLRYKLLLKLEFGNALLHGNSVQLATIYMELRNKNQEIPTKQEQIEHIRMAIIFNDYKKEYFNEYPQSYGMVHDKYYHLL